MNGTAKSSNAPTVMWFSLLRHYFKRGEPSIFEDGAQRLSGGSKHHVTAFGLARRAQFRMQLFQRHSLVDAAVGGERCCYQRRAPASQAGGRAREHAKVRDELPLAARAGAEHDPGLLERILRGVAKLVRRLAAARREGRVADAREDVGQGVFAEAHAHERLLRTSRERGGKA